MTVELGPEFFQDPYTDYRALRARGPVHRVRFPHGIEGWIVLSYDLARQVLTHADVSKDLNSASGQAAVDDAGAQHYFAGLAGAFMLNKDAPEHTRLRSLAARGFGRRVTRIGPRITEIADSLLDELDAESVVDLVETYAVPLPILAICEILGVPAADRGTFRSWSAHLLDTATSGQRETAAKQFFSYAADIVEDRHTRPGDDFVTDLITATNANGDKLSRQEIVAMIILLLIAGHETSTNAIASASAAILADADLADRLRHDNDHIPEFVEEVLRHQSPVQLGTFRHTAAPITLGEHHIPAGQMIWVSLAAANRDPDAFDEPETFLPSRLPNRHLAFGLGRHSCIGAPLARLEARIAISRLLARFPALSLVEGTPLRWRESLIVRGITHLPARLHSIAATAA